MVDIILKPVSIICKYPLREGARVLWEIKRNYKLLNCLKTFKLVFSVAIY